MPLVGAQDRFEFPFRIGRGDGIFSAHVQHINPLTDIFATAQNRWPLRHQPVFIDEVQNNIDSASCAVAGLN
jgi:2-haloacid dehalogenase/putative hydrolase of the HAD superfamily